MPDHAAQDLERVLQVEPQEAKAYYLLFEHHHGRADYQTALEVLELAKKRSVRIDKLEIMMGQALSDLNRPEEALEQYRIVLKQDPKNGEVHRRAGVLSQTLGDFQGAESSFETAMKLEPTNGETHRLALVSKKIPPEDPLVDRMNKHFGDTALTPQDRSQFGFALAKVMEDAKQYDRVFDYLHPANALAREAVGGEDANRAERERGILASARSVDWANLEQNHESEFAPIFVTGMPRSGTTLVEQIIASHSTVEGGGELGIIVKNITRAIDGREKKILPWSAVTTPAFKKIAADYSEIVGKLYPGAMHVTDKSIRSYIGVGPIKVAMPKARIVIVRRDPRDNLFSIYKNVFQEGTHRYAYSLTDLAATYKTFCEYVELWRELTPDWFYEIQYEDLIANPEEETRKLIDACGLEWEDACLNFHVGDRRVKTLSLYQVRQPIYKSSTKAWERYREDLSELFEALGPDYVDAAE